MYIFLLIVHVMVCLVLIMVVLLQAGRGGGFSDMLGGGQPQSLFGTQTNAFMVRATEVCAVIFIITSLSLAILSTQKGKSLTANKSLLSQVQTKVPVVPQPPPAPPQSENKVFAPVKAPDHNAASAPEALAVSGEKSAEANAK